MIKSTFSNEHNIFEDARLDGLLDIPITNTASESDSTPKRRKRKRVVKEGKSKYLTNFLESKEINRLRAQRTRRRKKEYYQDLEKRIDYLESENRRLHQVIEEYKRENFQLATGNLGYIANEFHQINDISDNLNLNENLQNAQDCNLFSESNQSLEPITT
jgi:antitoxin component YwqK of YwqJK toxin-antitoxin module